MWIERYTPKRCDPLTTQKLLEMTTMWEKDFSTECTMNAMLHPVCYSDHCSKHRNFSTSESEK